MPGPFRRPLLLASSASGLGPGGFAAPAVAHPRWRLRRAGRSHPAANFVDRSGRRGARQQRRRGGGGRLHQHSATLADLLAEDHSLKVHLSKEQIQIYLACGDIGGALDANGALIVGMKEQDGSGYAGIAYLEEQANGTTSVSVMIAQVIPRDTPIEESPAADAVPPMPR